MNTFVQLISLYEGAGLTVQSSLSPAHFPGFNLAEIPFTYIFNGDQQLCKGGGIALSEIYFFEALFTDYHPKKIFIIGNGFGWSTLALGLINPDAKIVAIDLCPRPEERRGIEVTNALGNRIPAEIVARVGRSPENVQLIVEEEFHSEIDFVFVDGGHNGKQLEQDFEACKSVAIDNCVFVFHDVINFMMSKSFLKIAKKNPQLISSFLLRTPSGMAITYPMYFDELITPVVRSFTECESRERSLLVEGKKRINNSQN